MSMTTYAIRVSILTRPWGRVQPAARFASCIFLVFQSSPARGGGCNMGVMCPCTARVKFQSSPARGGGCNRAERRANPWHGAVSILTRPWGRVQRGLENARERFPKRKCSSCQGVPCRALGG